MKGFTYWLSLSIHACGRILFVFLFSLLSAQQIFAQSLINSSFEEPRQSVNIPSFDFLAAAAVDGWETTASDNVIEIWSDGFGGVASWDADQHAELNAHEVSTLFQDVSGIPAGATTSFGFAHRGRDGLDTLRLTITDLGSDEVVGGGDDTVLFTKDYSTSNKEWARYTSAGEPSIVALGNTVRFAFQSVSTASATQAGGNFLDGVTFGLLQPSQDCTEPCCLGPCCLEDDCIETTAKYCAQNSGVFHGAGQRCRLGNCVIGDRCFPTSQLLCGQRDGEWLGTAACAQVIDP